MSVGRDEHMVLWDISSGYKLHDFDSVSYGWIKWVSVSSDVSLAATAHDNHVFSSSCCFSFSWIFIFFVSFF